MSGFRKILGQPGQWAAFLTVLVALVTTGCGGGGGGGGFLGSGDASPINIDTAALPDLTSTPYSVVLEASGGVEPYTWSLEDDGGTGITLNEDGILRADTLPGAGTYGITVTVTDANNRTARQSLTITVLAEDALQVSSTALPEGTAGVSYTAIVEASGGNEPYQWTVINNGGTELVINDDGLLTGIAPDAGGEYGLTLEVTDATGNSDRVSFILTVTGGEQTPLAIATESLPSTQEGDIYSAVLQATGGRGDYMWTLLNGGGSGLDLRDDGVLFGTAPAQGAYGISVSVQDDSNEVNRALVLTVSADGDPLQITTNSLPGATEQANYAAVLNAAGGTGNFTWALISSGGTGLRLSPDGVLSGFLQAGGTYGISFTVSDGVDSVTGPSPCLLRTWSPSPRSPLLQRRCPMPRRPDMRPPWPHRAATPLTAGPSSMMVERTWFCPRTVA